MLRKFQTILTVLLAFFIPLMFGSLVPEFAKAFLYSVSLSIKSMLLFLLPFIVFSLISCSIANLGGNAISLVFTLIICVFVSNLTAITTGYFVGYNYIAHLPIVDLVLAEDAEVLKPLWSFSLNSHIRNEAALFAGFALGLYMNYRPNKKVIDILNTVQGIAHKFLRKVFIPILPIFILGFVFKFEYEGSLVTLLGKFKYIFLIVIATQFIYLTSFLFIASNFNFTTFVNYLRNIIPAYFTALSTISSAATMPVTISVAERNLRNSLFANTIIPATVNIHTVGSALSFTILSLATMWAFAIPLPTVYQFAIFAIPYALAKYSVAGIPGGVIIVAVPLLVKYLGFTPEMAGIISGIYLLFDPFGTAANVTGNSIFAIIFYKRFGKHHKHTEHKPVKIAS